MGENWKCERREETDEGGAWQRERDKVRREWSVEDNVMRQNRGK